jgi:uncharacterized delta-60 repeat protein
MKYIAKKIIVALIPLVTMFVHVADIYAAAGTLDTSFSICSTTGNPVSLFDYINDITIQVDNNVVAVGASSVVGSTSVITTSTLILSRWNGTDGTLDTTFNATGSQPGFQALSVGDTTVGQAVTLQADGKIVVCGYTHQTAITKFLVARYNTNGTIDTSFNTVGYNTTSFGAGAQANSVKLQSTGKAIVAGTAVQGKGAFALARYNTNGTLDATFGTAGQTVTSIGFGAVLRQIAILGDDSIIAVGYVFDGASTDFVVAKYTAAGALDATFGVGGIVITPIDTRAEAYAVAIQSDGKIVVGGVSYVNNIGRSTLVRYSVTGTLDGTFGSGGIVTSALQNGASIYGVVLQTDGKIVVSGTVIGNFGPFFAVGRYTSTGALDVTFDSTGVGQNPASSSEAYSVALQSDGKIVAGGYVKINSYFNFLARWFA